jgi:recombination protein RecT
VAEASLTDLQQQNKDKAPPKSKTFMDMLDRDATKKGLAQLAGNLMRPERIAALALNAVRATPLLLECNPRSVLGAIVASVSMGLEFNTPLGHAFLIPYARNVRNGNQWVKVYDCQFQVGYKGYILLAHRSPYVDALLSDVIRKGDVFEHEKGTKTFLRHVPVLLDAKGNVIESRGDDDVLGAYCYTRHGTAEAATLMRRVDIEKIRSKSQTYNTLVSNVERAGGAKEKAYAQKKLDETPWVQWFAPMAAKSAIRSHCVHQLPLQPGDSLALATTIDQDGTGGRALIEDMSDIDFAVAVQEGKADVTVTYDDEDAGDDAPPPKAREGETIDHETGEVTTDAPKPQADKPAKTSRRNIE